MEASLDFAPRESRYEISATSYGEQSRHRRAVAALPRAQTPLTLTLTTDMNRLEREYHHVSSLSPSAEPPSSAMSVDHDVISLISLPPPCTRSLVRA